MASRHRRSRSSDSQVVAALKARREHGSTIEAVRAADPRTKSGYSAQQAALATAATWRHRHQLMPISATAATACAGSIWPGWTAAGLLAGAAAQDIARRTEAGAWTAGERAAAATWAVGAAGWSAAHWVVPGGSWWQWLIGLAGATGAQSVAWWRTRDEQPEPAAPPIYVQAAAAVLGELALDGGPLTHSQITAITMPAPQVVVVDVALAYGVHTEDAATPALRRTLQARLQLPAPPQVDTIDANTLRITMSWSLALDEETVAWRPGRSGDGQSWLGLADDRRDIHIPTYSRGGADSKVRVHHGWLVGRTGGGKSTTLTALLLPGLSGGWELVLVVDGKGDSVVKIERHVARYARLSGTRFEQVITIAYGIMRSRQRRGWTGPSPTDPVVTLVIDEATTVKENIDNTTQRMVYELSRMGESLGVRVIQGLQIPVIEDLIGEGGFRANTRWVIGHVSADPTYSSIAAQSTNDDVSLLGLPVGRAAVIVEGQVVARSAKVTFVDQDDVDEAMRGVEPAQLHPADMAAVRPLWDLTAGWSDPAAIEAGDTGPEPLPHEDLRMHRWLPSRLPAAPLAPAAAGSPTSAAGAGGTVVDEDITIGTDDLDTGGRLHLVPSPPATPGNGISAPPVVTQAALASARDSKSWVLAQLATGPATAADLVAREVYSRSQIFSALGTLVTDGVLTKEGTAYRLLTPDELAPPAVSQ